MTKSAVATAAVALSLAMTPVGVAEAQEGEQPTLRRSAKASAAQSAGVRAAAGQDSQTQAVAAQRRLALADPLGDAEPSQLAAADMSEADVDLVNDGSMILSVSVPGGTDPVTDPNWDSDETFIEWDFDTNNDGLPDYMVQAFTVDGAFRGFVFDVDANLVCETSATFTATGRYVLETGAICIGDPGGARFRAAFVYDNGADVFFDFAPDAGFSPPMANREINAKPAARLGNIWYLRNTLSAGPADWTFAYGRPDDFPLMCDWDGDGLKTPGVVRGNTWYLRNSNSPGASLPGFNYGAATDSPVCGDWNADGIDTPGVVRGKTWHLRNSNSGGSANLAFGFGRSTDFPIVGDWNDDGTRTIGVVRGSTWYLRNSNSAGPTSVTFNYGVETDLPVVGNWRPFLPETAGVLRARTWLLRETNSDGPAQISFTYGPQRSTPLLWR